MNRVFIEITADCYPVVGTHQRQGQVVRSTAVHPDLLGPDIRPELDHIDIDDSAAVIVNSVLTKPPLEVVSVTAGIPFQPVVTTAPHQVIIIVATREIIPPGAPFQPVVTRVAMEVISTDSALEPITAPIAVEAIVSHPSEQVILARSTGQGIVSPGPIQGIPRRIGVEVVMALRGRLHPRLDLGHIPDRGVGKANFIQHIGIIDKVVIHHHPVIGAYQRQHQVI